MKITNIYINNFKSLSNFNLDLSDFTCLIGNNGSGKTTILEAVEFFSDLMTGSDDIDWLSKYDINNIYSPKNIDFIVTCNDSDDIVYKWKGIFNVREKYCIKENITVYKNGLEICELEANMDTYSFSNNKPVPQNFKYIGSIMSQLEKRVLKRINLYEFKTFIADITLVKSEIDYNYIYSINDRENNEILKSLKIFFPTICDFYADNGKIKIEDINNKINNYNINQMNRSFYNIFNILTKIYRNESVILIDDIDNGIDENNIMTLVNYLSATFKCQILTTTHNTYDKIAKKYKNCINLVDINKE